MRPTECARAPNGGFYGVSEERNEGVAGATRTTGDTSMRGVLMPSFFHLGY